MQFRAFNRLVFHATPLIAGAVLCGCDGRPARVYQADVDTAAVAASIRQDHDRDESGGISKDEIRPLAAIAGSFEQYDRDNDGQLTEDEIAERLAAEVFDPRKALLQASCIVKKDGRPIAGAQVRLVPLSYFADHIPPAQGVSDSRGVAVLALDEKDLPAGAPHVKGLIRPGLYRVEVTHPSIAIPTKFNSASALSVEVSTAALATGSILLNLDP